jgi:Zn-dependent protease
MPTHPWLPFICHSSFIILHSGPPLRKLGTVVPTKRGSIHLFRLAGIDVYLHWSWFLLAYYVIQTRRENYSTYFWPALEYIALFVIVTMHEFGHSLACKQVGGRADQIVLWPFGGVAYVAPPRRPGATLWCIAAGPLVNVVLFPILLGSWFLAQGLGWPGSAPDAYTFTVTLCYIDLMLLVFNLLPIFPLDGGQILQSLLWFVFGYARSLMIAASLGLVGVAGLILFAIHEQAWWLGFMCILVVLYCWGGLQRARALSRLAAAPRHQGLACPACREAPPAGAFWRCGQCGNGFDVFASGAVCPHCGAQVAVVPCLACGTPSPIQSFQTGT